MAQSTNLQEKKEELKIKLYWDSNKTWWSAFELLAQPTNLQEEEGMKSKLYRNPWTRLDDELLHYWAHWGYGKITHQKGHGSSGCLPACIALITSSIWLPLNCILHNKPVIVKCFPWFPLVFRKLSNLRRWVWEPQFVIKLNKSVRNLGIHYLQLASEQGVVSLERLNSQLWGLH